MKARQARKIFKRLSKGGSTEGYKCSTIAAAYTRSVGIYCRPEDALLVSQLSRMFAMAAKYGMFQSYINQTNMELAS